MTASNKLIQVFEHQKLCFDIKGPFLKHHFEAMVKFNEQHGNKYFTVVHKGVRFSSYVGVIRVGQLTIEILPKADKNTQSDKKLWQSILLHMLNVSQSIQIEHLSEATLQKKHNSILDVYFELYLNEVEQLVNKGLIRKYRQQHSNQSVLKGKILFTQNIRHNIVHQERFFCQHQTYDKNHLLHQILLQALVIIKDFASPTLQDKLNRLLFEFQEFEKTPIRKNQFDRVIFDRKNSNYRKAFNIARIIILNYSPNLNYGNDKLLTILFDMNNLWEQYIFRIIHKHKPKNFEIIAQDSRHFWETKNIRPDIVIKNKDNTWIIDTKWKIVSSSNPSDDDLKQMFAYNLHWNAPRSLLIYPYINQTDSHFGNFHYNGFEYSCKTGFVKLTDGEIIYNTKTVAKDIFDKLMQ